MERRTGDKIEINGDYQYNAFYTGKAPQRFWHFTKITEAIKSLQLKKGDNVLDVGCGSGLVSFFMAKDNEVNVTAIDANDSALAFANQKFVLPNLQFKKGLLDELNLKKGSYQKIIFLEESIRHQQHHFVMIVRHKLISIRIL